MGERAESSGGGARSSTQKSPQKVNEEVGEDEVEKEDEDARHLYQQWLTK